MIINLQHSRKRVAWLVGLGCLLAASLATANGSDSMMAKARAQGQLPVIVKMRMAPADALAIIQPRARALSRFKKLLPPGIPAPSSVISRYQEQLLSKLPQQASKRVSRFKSIPFLGLSVTPAELASLQNDPDVEFIEEDRLLRASLDISIPLIGADQVWNEPFTGSGAAVAIIDSGVDSSHPFLTGRVVSEACYSTTYAPLNATSLCPTDTLGNLIHAGAGTAQPCNISGCDHGTHVAGIAAGNGSSSGVAKDASIIAIQVFSRFDDANFCGSSAPCIAAFTSDIISALERVRDLQGSFDIAAANMSLGGGTVSSISSCDSNNASTKSIIDQLRALGIATVIAAGNNGNSAAMSSPGCISTAITVGASSDSDGIASFSNSGSWLDFMAPGVSIISSVPGGGFTNKSGTSMATPHVTGAWALMKSKRDAVFGSSHTAQTVNQIAAALTNEGTIIHDARNGMDFPRIQLNAASDTFVAGQAPPANLIIDDLDGSVVTGSFPTTITDAKSYGGTAVATLNTGSNTFRFSTTPPNTGYYRVYGWWPALASSTDQAEFSITHTGGQATFPINQRITGNQWVDLGSYQFDSAQTATVDISNPNGGIAVADAVRLEYLPVQPLTFSNWQPQTTLSLPSGEVGSVYSSSIDVVSGVAPLQWSIIDGDLPPGLSLNSNTGEVSGTPQAVTTSIFSVRVTDATGSLVEDSFSLTISGTPTSTITQTTLNAILGIAGHAEIRIDDFLPNPGVNNQTIGTVPTDAFTNAGIGLISDGDYADLTSAQVTSDLVRAGNSISWTFVDASNPSIKATIQSLGFQYGSVDETVTVTFLDVNGNLLDSAVLPTVTGTASIGFSSATSDIHKVVITQTANDLWVLGSFTLDPGLTDIAFDNLQISGSLTTTLNATPTSPQIEGTAITFTAQASGGSGNYEYEFWLNGPATGNSWAVQQAYSASKTWLWDSNGDVGANLIRVRSREIGSSNAFDGSASVNYAIDGSTPGISIVSFDSVAAAALATGFKIDDALPNSVPVNGQTIGTIASTAFTNIGIGLVSDGDYGDFTSSQVTSDIVSFGTPVTWTFVDPANPALPATVSQIAFRYGSVDDTVTATFLDINGAVIDTAILPPVVATASIGFSASASIIHSVRFTQNGSDIWVLGSFTENPALTDISFTDLQTIATLSTTLNSDIPSPQNEGSTITFTAQASGGSGSYEYEFWLNGPATGNTWVIQQAYSANNTWLWDSTGNVGSNAIRVRSREIGSSNSFDGSANLNYSINSTAPGIAVVSFDSVATAPLATQLKIDDALPNSAPVNGQTIGTIPGAAFTNIGIGLVSDGDYGDYTSAQVTSDIVSFGNPITWTFVDSANPALPATVSQLAFRYGSVDDTVTVTFLDINGVVIDTAILPPVVATASIGFSASTSIIHSVQFTQNGGDIWVLGSFTEDPQLTDISFTDHQVAGSLTTTLNSDIPSPQNEGTAITYTAQASGGSGNYEYEFWLNGPTTGNTWVIQQAYSASNAWLWDSSGDVGDNAIRVWSREVGSSNSFDGTATNSYTINSTSPNITVVSFDSVASDPQAVQIVIDNPLPNSNAVNGQIIGTVPSGAFTNIGIGLISDGDYGDFTSAQVTSDIETAGTPITWTFVDPGNPATPATVSQLAFRYGSVDETVTVTFFDINGNAIDSTTLPPVVATQSIGFSVPTSIIHSVQFTQSGRDIWLIGSFTENTAVTDISFVGYTIP